MKQDKVHISIAVLVIFHLVGIGGVLLADPTEFLSLTPLNLLLTLTIIMINHTDWKKWWVFALTYLLGYFVEVLGVNTGFPFGAYEYGTVLGPKLIATPLMIGVNWLILLYASNSIASSFGLTAITKSLGAAALMVILDYAIEPVAIQYEFWTWAQVDPPFENYMAWFVIAFGLSLIWQLSKIELNKKIAIAVYGVEFGFFAALNLL
jgi:putative membrane protein